MSEETKRILKVFGIAVTDFEESRQQTAEGLSSGQAAALPDACRQLLDLQEKWMEATRVVFDMQKALFRQVLEGAGTETS
ncbi:MAG: hypothetical protein ACE5IM_10435 [Nitrospinota bacterium]